MNYAPPTACNFSLSLNNKTAERSIMFSHWDGVINPLMQGRHVITSRHNNSLVDRKICIIITA